MGEKELLKIENVLKRVLLSCIFSAFQAFQKFPDHLFLRNTTYPVCSLYTWNMFCGKPDSTFAILSHMNVLPPERKMRKLEKGIHLHISWAVILNYLSASLVRNQKKHYQFLISKSETHTFISFKEKAIVFLLLFTPFLFTFRAIFELCFWAGVKRSAFCNNMTVAYCIKRKINSRQVNYSP